MASRKASVFFKALKILLPILLVLFVVLAFVTARLAIGHPTFYPVPEFDARDKSTIANIITRLARSLVDKEGRVVDTAVLKLSQDEVQTLVNAAVRGSDPDYGLERLSYAAEWNAGRMQVRYSSILSRHTALNFQVEVTPSVDRGNLTLIPGGGSVGRLRLPRFALRFAADKLAKRAMQDDSVRTMLSAFTRIEPGDDGTLLLMFDPRDVNTVVRILRSAGEDPSAPDDEEEDDEDDEESEEYDDEDEPDEEDAEEFS